MTPDRVNQTVVTGDTTDLRLTSLLYSKAAFSSQFGCTAMQTSNWKHFKCDIIHVLFNVLL